MEVITLTDTEAAFAQHIGKRRFEFDRSKNVREKQQGQGDPLQIAIDGVGAEFAFCKQANLFFDINYDRLAFPDYDCVAPSGTKIDVKCTRRKGGNLVVIQHKHAKEVEAFVLMVAHGKDFEYIGWTSRVRLISREFVKDVGHGPCYFMPRQHLWQDIYTLLHAPWERATESQQRQAR